MSFTENDLRDLADNTRFLGGPPASRRPPGGQLGCAIAHRGKPDLVAFASFAFSAFCPFIFRYAD